MSGRLGYTEPPINCAELNPPESVLLSVPPSLVRELCVIPVAANSHSITLVRPSDDLFTEETCAKLDFVLNRKFKWISCNRCDIEAAIDRLYADDFAGIANCDQDDRTRCPHRWRSLGPTDDERIRFCSECGKDVVLCRTQQELDAQVGSGKIVAVTDELTLASFPRYFS